MRQHWARERIARVPEGTVGHSDAFGGVGEAAHPRWSSVGARGVSRSELERFRDSA